jgi:hypothetical protein
VDPVRFDDFTRKIGRNLSRRSMMAHLGRAIGGGVLAGLGIRGRAAVAADQCIRESQPCNPDDDHCCQGPYCDAGVTICR